MDLKRIFLILILSVTAVCLFSQEERPSLSLKALDIKGDKSIGEAVADSIEGTLILTLRLMGQYEIVDPEWIEWSGSFDSISSGNELDYIIFGSVEALPEGGVVIELSVYSRASGEILLTETSRTDSYMEVFNATDDLMVKLLEGLTSDELVFGVLQLKRTGPPRSYSIEIDGEFVGSDMYEIPFLPVGMHSVRIYEKAGYRTINILKTDVEIPSENPAVVEFSMISKEEYDEYINSRTALISSGSLPFEIDLNPVTVAEAAEVFDWALQKGYVHQAKGEVYLVTDPDDLDRRDDPFLLYLTAKREKKAAAQTSLFLISDGHIIPRAGKENEPVARLSWYGAVAYCHFKSLKEGVESCYDLESWTCDFSKPGYRVPLEQERVVIKAARMEDPDNWKFYNTGAAEDSEWVWDFWGRGPRDPDEFFTGPKRGMDMVTFGEEAKRHKERPGKGYDDVTLRISRTAEAPEGSISSIIPKKRFLKRNTITPWISGILNSDVGGVIEMAGSGVSYARTLNSWYSFGFGLDISVSLDPFYFSNYEGDFVLLFFIAQPLIIGDISRFAFSLDVVVTPQGGGDGPPYVMPMFSFYIYRFHLKVMPAFLIPNTGGFIGYFALGYGIQF